MATGTTRAKLAGVGIHTCLLFFYHAPHPFDVWMQSLDALLFSVHTFRRFVKRTHQYGRDYWVGTQTIMSTQTLSEGSKPLGWSWELFGGSEATVMKINNAADVVEHEHFPLFLLQRKYIEI